MPQRKRAAAAETNLENWPPPCVNQLRIKKLLDHGAILLRQVFKNRWMCVTGAEWEEGRGTASMTRLIRCYQPDKLMKLSKTERGVIESGIVDGWDITALTGIILNCTRALGMSTGAEVNHVINIRRARNIIFHSPNILWTPDSDFGTHWTRVEQALLHFRADPVKLNAIKNATHLEELLERRKKQVSEESTKQALKLQAEADELLAKEEYEVARRIYGDALELCDLSDTDLAGLHAARANAYLQEVVAKKPVNATPTNSAFLRDRANEAQEHARRTIDFQPVWFRGYELLGEAYSMLLKYDKAIVSLEFATSLAPTNEAVKHALYDCRRLAGMQSRGEDKYPNASAASQQAKAETKASLELIRDQLGMRCELHHLEPIFVIMLDVILPGQGDVYSGHQFRLGLDGVRQDFKTAGECYTSGVHAGNAEAMYSLALMYQKGQGVSQNFGACITLLIMAASEPIMNPNTESRVRGVSEAEHALGLIYEEGVGVERNLTKAVAWYEKASLNGFGGASTNLGQLYMNSDDVPRDPTKGYGYLRLGAMQGSGTAMRLLAEHFLRSNYPELAETWYAYAIANNYAHTDLDDQAFAERIADVEKEIAKWDQKVGSWERVKGLTRDNLTFHDRYTRVETSWPQSAQLMMKKANATAIMEQKSKGNIYRTRETPGFDPEILQPFANRGSTTAQRLLRAVWHYNRADQICSVQLPEDPAVMADYIHEIAACFREEPSAFLLPSDEAKIHLTDFARRMLTVAPTGTESQLDRDARICIAALDDNNASNLQFIEATKLKYPDELRLHLLAPKVCRHLRENDRGMQLATESLQKCPGNLDLMYQLAECSWVCAAKKGRPAKALKAFDDFVKVAPHDHPKLPRAFYALGYISAEAERITHEEMQKRVKKGHQEHPAPVQYSEAGRKYYNLGLDAEKDQLPPFRQIHLNRKLKDRLETRLELIQHTRSDWLKHEDNEEAMVGPGASRASTTLEAPEIDHDLLISPHRAYTVNHYFKTLAAELAADAPGAEYRPGRDVRQYAPSAPHRHRLEPIKIVEMEPCNSRLYSGRILHATAICDHFTIGTFSSLLVEDEKHDVAPVKINGLDERLRQHRELLDGLKYGANISLMNPYMDVRGDGHITILIEDPSSIMLDTRDSGGNPRTNTRAAARRCRFCAKDGSPSSVQCTECQKAWYCNEECKDADKRSLAHELICKILK